MLAKTLADEHYNDLDQYQELPNPWAHYREMEGTGLVIMRGHDGLFPEHTPDPELVRQIQEAWPTLLVRFDRQEGYWKIWDHNPAKWKYEIPITTVRGPNGEYRPLDSRTVDNLRRAIYEARHSPPPGKFDELLEVKAKERQARERQTLRDDNLRELKERMRHTKVQQNFDRGIMTEEPKARTAQIFSIPGMAPGGSTR